ncbi:MAG: PadR family transcriptional regulator [Actinomycetota bacterium]|nr:PadR family transcriptional regulator [Actinomycetota bacterium]
MKLEIALLGWLATREMSGYDINSWLTSEGKFIGYDRYSSQVYRNLNRMHAAGLVEYDVRPRDNAPDAKVYRVTDQGLDLLHDWIKTDYTSQRPLLDPEFNFRVEISAMLDITRCIEIVQGELQFRLNQIALLRDRDRSFSTVGARPEVDLVAVLTVYDEEHLAGVHQMDYHLNWLRHMIVVLEDIKGKAVDESMAESLERVT